MGCLPFVSSSQTELVSHSPVQGDASEDLPLMVLDRKAEQNFLWLMPGERTIQLLAQPLSRAYYREANC